METEIIDILDITKINCLWLMEEVLKIIALYLKKIAQISLHEDIIPTSVSW